MITALLLVDIQNDFLPGGALAVSGGNQVISVANKLLQLQGVFNFVVASQDWHPSNHKSFASQHEGSKPGDKLTVDGYQQELWPDHCVENSKGSELSDHLLHKRIDVVFRKGTNIYRDSYSAFFDNRSRLGGAHDLSHDANGDTGLHKWLSAKGVKRLFVMGLATEYCVLYSVLDAIKLGYLVTVVADGCRSVDLRQGDGQRALALMGAAGATLINSSSM